MRAIDAVRYGWHAGATAGGGADGCGPGPEPADLLAMREGMCQPGAARRRPWRRRPPRRAAAACACRTCRRRRAAGRRARRRCSTSCTARRRAGSLWRPRSPRRWTARRCSGCAAARVSTLVAELVRATLSAWIKPHSQTTGLVSVACGLARCDWAPRPGAGRAAGVRARARRGLARRRGRRAGAAAAHALLPRRRARGARPAAAGAARPVENKSRSFRAWHFWQSHCKSDMWCACVLLVISSLVVPCAPHLRAAFKCNFFITGRVGAHSAASLRRHVYIA